MWRLPTGRAGSTTVRIAISAAVCLVNRTHWMVLLLVISSPVARVAEINEVVFLCE